MRIKGRGDTTLEDGFEIPDKDAQSNQLFYKYFVRFKMEVVPVDARLCSFNACLMMVSRRGTPGKKVIQVASLGLSHRFHEPP